MDATPPSLSATPGDNSFDLVHVSDQHRQQPNTTVNPNVRAPHMESTDANPPHSVNPSPGKPESPLESTMQFEFHDRENIIFAELAARMQFVGLFTMVIGILVILLGSVTAQAGTIISGALYAVIGLWTDRASESFRKIAVTRGKDISHLRSALHDLRKLYTFQFWICLLSMLVVLVAGAFMLWAWK
jgi:hypothetical protein